MSKTIFISGSRSINYLNYNIEYDLHNEIIIPNISNKTKPINIIVGDASGVDSLIQTYLSDHKYYDVTVYHSGNKPRNYNNSKFRMKKIDYMIPINSQSDMFKSKDIAMTHDCDEAWCIWDGHSKGTLDNIKRCVARDIPVRVYNYGIGIPEKYYVDRNNLKKFVKQMREEYKNNHGRIKNN